MYFSLELQDIIFFYNMEEIDYIKWGARLLIVIIIALFIWSIYYRKKYKYMGINDYKRDIFIDNVFSYFKNVKPILKHKKKRINKTEEKCRTIIQKIYSRKFPSVRPKFLKSPRTGKNLELDCYNDDLKIAIEYNGKQHYNYTPYFHKNKKDFYSQVHRDDWKRKRCKEMGIRLIEIPYWVSDIDLENYILNELRKKGCL